MRNQREQGITLIALVITIIILLILAGVTIAMLTGDNGILNQANQSSEENNKQTAAEKINLKITNAQMNTYTEEQRMPTLKELSLDLKEDDEIAYITEASRVGSAEYDVKSENPSLIYTKLKEYPYEFEIDSKLRLAAIDGMKIADSDQDKEINDLKQEVQKLKTTINYDPTEVLNLSSTVKSLDGNIKRTGNVVSIVLTLTLSSNLAINTWSEVATIKDPSLIPTSTVYGISHQSTKFGNFWIYNDGTMNLRSSSSSAVYGVNATYIVEGE